MKNIWKRLLKLFGLYPKWHTFCILNKDGHTTVYLDSCRCKPPFVIEVYPEIEV